MFAALIPLFTTIAGKVAGNLFPDPADEIKRKEVENQILTQIMAASSAIEQAAAAIIQAEAASRHWLAANWRPLTMLTFVGLIVARWLGWTAPNMSEAEYLSIYELIKIGLGGYVVGRSAEKVLPMIVQAMKK